MTDQATDPAGPPERPGRYQRSVAGGVGALLVLLLVVVAFVAFRGLVRDNPDGDVEPVDYLAGVSAAQAAGMQVVYPPSLPEDWVATSVQFAGGEQSLWGLGMLTDEGEFVGVRQQEAALESLVSEHVDEDAVAGDVVTVPGALVPEWQQWSDEGGDQAFSAEVGGTQVLVFGTAPTEDLLAMVALLTDQPLE